MINLHLLWMAKNAFSIFPIGIAVSYIFQFLLISTKCHNPLENHGRNEHHIFFIFAFPNLFLAWRWKMLFLHCVLQCFMFFSEMVWSIEFPFSSRKNLTFVRAETGKFYISHGWLKMCGTCQPFEVRFLLFWSFCSEVEHVIMHWKTMDQMKNAPFSYSCPQRLTPLHPPFCKQQRNLQRSNIFQPSNIFQDSTSSNALHMTLLHPPHPPHLYTRTTFLV